MPSLHSYYVGNNLVFWQGHKKRIIEAIGPDVVKYCNDFVMSPLISADAPLGWTVTLVEAGAGESTITMPDAVGGALLLTTDANEDDGICMQLDGESFELTSDQRAVYFGIKFKISDVDQTDILVGLGITDTTPLGGISDAVYFESLDASASVSCVTEKNATETQTDSVGTLADDMDITLEWFFNGSNVEFFVNGVSVATHTANIPDDEALTPTIHFLTGEAAANTCQIDWVRCVQIGR